uniref:Uncharacterized protein n=1 Tax=Panagrolaimus sp. PS1159 TaxID=55785 RepID=A0AC35G8N5_9BILA
MLFTNSVSFRYPRRTSVTPNTPCDNFRNLILAICFYFILPINILSIGIRYYTRVDSRLYSEPCNITTDLIILYLHSLHHQKDGYDKILQKDTWNNSVGGKETPEIETARKQKAAIMEQIKVQTEFRQKCAGINIRSDQKNIIEKAQFWAIWLFRIASVLTLIYGISLSDYYFFKNFDEKLINFEL